MSRVWIWQSLFMWQFLLFKPWHLTRHVTRMKTTDFATGATPPSVRPSPSDRLANLFPPFRNHHSPATSPALRSAMLLCERNEDVQTDVNNTAITRPSIFSVLMTHSHPSCYPIGWGWWGLHMDKINPVRDNRIYVLSHAKATELY